MLFVDFVITFLFSTGFCSFLVSDFFCEVLSDLNFAANLSRNLSQLYFFIIIPKNG